MDVVKVDMQGVDVTEEDAGRLGGVCCGNPYRRHLKKKKKKSCNCSSCPDKS